MKKCRHREDGMVHCAKCEGTEDEHAGHPSYNISSEDETTIEGTDAK